VNQTARLAPIFEYIYVAQKYGAEVSNETSREPDPAYQADFTWRFGIHFNRTVYQREASIGTVALERKDSVEIRSTGDRPSPSPDGKDPKAVAVLGIRALRLGSRTRKFIDERPVPKFKEKMNAGTISEWLSQDDHTQGRN
jgi:hypothetical protein